MDTVRPLNLAALGFLLLGAAPQDEAPLSKEIAELARRYAAVVAWEGVFEAAESGAVNWTSVGGLQWGSKRLNRSSSGRFRIERRSYGWEPERGMFSWAAGNQEVSGEASGAYDSQESGWDKFGRGHEWHDTGSGRTPLVASEFSIWLASGSAWVRKGDWSEPMRITRVGRSVSDENLEAGLTRRKTTPLNRVFDSPTFVSPLDTKFVNDKTNHRIASRGPGVLVFACEGKSRGDTQISTMEITHRSRVTLFPVYDDLEVQVTIKDYETWMPKGSIPQPTSPGSHLEAHAVLVQKKPAGPPPKVKRFRFELVEVSREPGVCMNWPRFGADGDAPPAEDPKPDLRFGPGNGAVLTKEDLAAELPPVKNPAGLESAAARIDGYDFGATADLRVTCDLEDGREICGILRSGGDKLLSIPLPYRRAGLRVAQAWKEKMNARGTDGDDDDDEPVGDGQKGDGFSNFEEYRGFVMNRKHLRTDPVRKGLFVRNLLGRKAQPGLARFESVTGLEVHDELRSDEMPMSRRMNVNRSAGSPRRSAEHQCGVVLDLLDGGDFSSTVIQENEKQEKKVGRPKNTDGIYILKSLFDPGKGDEAASTIAHELLHSIGVLHHGDTDLGFVEWIRKEDKEKGTAWFEERPVGGADVEGEPIRILNSDGQELRAQDHPNLFATASKGYVGCFGGQHSGDVACLMRYHSARAFRPRLGGMDQRVLLGELEPLGKTLCSSPAGTDFNAPGAQRVRYGDATRGNCSKRFCVRDDAPAR